MNYKFDSFFLDINIVFQYLHFLSLTLSLIILFESGLSKSYFFTWPGLPAYGAFPFLFKI